MDLTDRCELEVVIPVYNEERILERSVEQILSAAHLFPPQFSVVICNNGSSDSTGQIARHLASVHDNVVSIDLEQKGRGRVLQFVWSRTRARYSLYMDVDLSTELSAVPATVALLEQGADLVIGSRLHPASHVKRSLKRGVLSRTYNLVVSSLFRVPRYTDMQCGFKAVRVERFRVLSRHIENENWFFDTELILLALSMQMDVRVIPVVWNEDADSRVKIMSTILEDIRGLARLRRRSPRSLTRFGVLGRSKWFTRDSRTL